MEVEVVEDYKQHVEKHFEVKVLTISLDLNQYDKKHQTQNFALEQ